MAKSRRRASSEYYPKPCTSRRGVDGRDAHLGHADLLRENDVAACGIRGGSGSGSTSGLGRGEAGGAGDRWARGGTAGHAPRGPRVTATASASLSMPSWILMRDFMSKVRSLASARTLMATRRGPATRETRADTLEPWMACEGSGWKRRNQPPHFFFPRTAGRSRARAGRATMSHRGTRETRMTSPRSRRRSRGELVGNAPSGRPLRRVLRAPGRDSKQSEAPSLPEKRRVDFPSRSRRGPENGAYRARGEGRGLHDAVHVATTCVGSVGERASRTGGT